MLDFLHTICYTVAENVECVSTILWRIQRDYTNSFESCPVSITTCGKGGGDESPDRRKSLSQVLDPQTFTRI